MTDKFSWVCRFLPRKAGWGGVLVVLFAAEAFGATFVSPISAALSNVVDATAARAAFADYTNNCLRIAAVRPDEWDNSNPRRKVDRFPASMPFQLAVGSDPLDRAMAEAALETVATSMPRHINGYFARHHLLAPVQQWLIRRAHPSVVDEASYLRIAAHPTVWRAKDFDLSRLAQLASQLTSNSVPVLAVLHPVYEEFKPSPIKRAEPLVDYPDPRPEETYALPFGVSVVLRAPERRRKFRFFASGYPFGGRMVNYKWVPVGVSVGGFPYEDWRERESVSPARGYGEVRLDWNGGTRRDVLVFARYGNGAWGPPSVVSFYSLPNERRQYAKDGRIGSVKYTESVVIPQLFQNKPWTDVYQQDSLGNVIGFVRRRTGRHEEDRFSWLGELVTETHAGDMPKTTKKVRYFTRSDDPTTLDYEITDETVEYKMHAFVPRDRGECPSVRPRRR